MNEKAAILINSVRYDLNTIAEIYTALARYQLPTGVISPEAEDEMILIAYRFHNLYNAFENIFLNIATMFENSIDETGRWHAQLLERMRLDALPLRPHVIDKKAYTALDELRRFRHLFRHAYAIQLDPDRLHLVLKKTQALKEIYQQQIEKFLEFVSQMD